MLPLIKEQDYYTNRMMHSDLADQDFQTMGIKDSATAYTHKNTKPIIITERIKF